MIRKFPLLALGLVGTLVLSSCGNEPDPAASDSPSPSADSADTLEGRADLDAYLGQRPEWTECEEAEKFECATVDVPLNYSDPSEQSIQIKLSRHAEHSDGKPPILMNPGGPGVSGVDTVQEGLGFISTQKLRENFAVIGFDPRGVGASEPLECLTDEQMDADRQLDLDPSTVEGRELALQKNQELIDACVENSGSLVKHVSTEDTAKDLDIIRDALGEDQLNYLGFSYGTKLGATYADLFPDNVGKFVLDGALSPTASAQEVTVAQAEGFEKSLASWAQWCADNDDCTSGSDADTIIADVRDLLAEIDSTPMVAEDGREVPVGDFISGFILPLYSQQSWPVLDSLISDARQDDPTVALTLADSVAGRQSDGTYDPDTSTPFFAINCSDYPIEDDDALMEAQAQELTQASPTFGPYMGYSGLGCRNWPAEPKTHDGDFSAAGAGDIVVIGTTGDPATPYQWSVELAETLESGVLVTNDGEGHGAYGPENQCISDIVDEYLVDDITPHDGVSCE